MCFFIAVLSGLISCKNDGRSMFKADNGVEFDTLVTTERHYLDGDTLKPYCDIHVRFVYPVDSRKISVDTLQGVFVKSVFGTSYDEFSPSVAVRKYVQNYIENYKNDAATYRENVHSADQMNRTIYGMGLNNDESPVQNIFYSYYETLSDSIVYNRYDILSFQVKQSNNKGGVAAYNSYRNYVIHLKTGTLITENDIFNAGYDTVLQSFFVASLLEQNGVKTIRDLEDLGFFGVQEMVPNKNFLINDKGVLYTFNKGEYSAYQLQAPEIFIPYDAIRSLLRPNTVVSKLADL